MPDYTALARELSASLPAMELREYEPMNTRCSFKIGGPARLMLLPGSARDAARALAILRAGDANVLIAGNCTNLLVPDEGYMGAVVCMGQPMSSLESPDGTHIRAGAGASLASAAAYAAQLGLTGLEFAHGIPGSVGGGCAMNAGAYGGELKDALESVEFIDEDGIIRVLPVSELGMGYRHSLFSDSGRLVTSALFRLAPGDGEEIRGKMRSLAERRRASQPLDMPSAGSTFKRPETGYAAELIDRCGLKGLTIGGAVVSEKHTGFIVNLGGATFADVTALIREVRRRVFEQTGVLLEPEVKIVEPVS